VLEKDGRFEIRTVNNGFDAGMMVKEYRPDLIVLDVMLPDINGKEVCQRVRNDKTMDDVRIICISGMVEEDKIEDLKAELTISHAARVKLSGTHVRTVDIETVTSRCGLSQRTFAVAMATCQATAPPNMPRR
jgi:CheY-like chemotaxis protein